MEGSSHFATSAPSLADCHATTLPPDRVNTLEKVQLVREVACFMGAGAGYPLRALLGQNKNPSTFVGAAAALGRGRRNPRSWDRPTTHTRVDYRSVVGVDHVYPPFVHT